MSEYTGGGRTVSIELVEYQHSEAQIAITMDFTVDVTSEKDETTAYFTPEVIRQMASDMLRLVDKAEGKA